MGQALIADPGPVGKGRDGNPQLVVEYAKRSKFLYFLCGEMSMSCPLDDDLHFGKLTG